MGLGPMVDLKLIALQSGTFSRAFAFRFPAVTWTTAVLAARASDGGCCETPANPALDAVRVQRVDSLANPYMAVANTRTQK